MESRRTSGPPPWEPNTVPVPFEVQGGIGTLFILGGSSTCQVMYDEYFRIAGGPNARVIHIPSATRTFEEIPDLREYYCEFYEQNPASFAFLHTYDRAVAADPRFAQPLDSATGVWFGGGSQNLLAELFLGTEVVLAIHRVLERGGIVSGTSSGAAIMADAMICRGYDEVELGQGFALYPRAIVDSHFTGRERQKRLPRAVLQRPDHIGVGVDEKSALVLHGNHIGVIGLLGKSVWYHFPDPAAGRVYRYRLGVGESVELPIPVRGASRHVLEEALRAIRPPDVITTAELAESDEALPPANVGTGS
jgi:cyanophycinase